MNDNLIAIKLTGYILGIYQNELVSLLKANPTLWETAIKRGKHISRAEKERHRKTRGKAGARDSPVLRL
ncbi:MAG: hypothetical protein ABFC57_03340 [Veillonellales bacterium]